jgi:hypothetical protein
MSRFVPTRGRGWLISPFLVSAAALVIAGCGGGGGAKTSAGAASAATPPKPVGAPGATVRFLRPRSGSTVTGSTVSVRVRISGFALDARDVGKPARQGFGHLVFSLDGGRQITSVTPTTTYRHVRPGRHTLVAYLANNDRSLTGVTARVTFTVRRPPPPAAASVVTPAQTTSTTAQPAPSTNTQPAPSAPPPPQPAPKPAPTPAPSSGGGSGIPQGGGGDGDADNHGGPDDGDGNM